MQTIVLIMRRKAIAQGLAQSLGGGPRVILEPSHRYAQARIRAGGADIALVEIAESGSHGAAKCLALCDRLREDAPQCKLLLMCPEQDQDSVARAIEAKCRGRIDDFVFYDVTTDYLVSKLLSM